MNLRNITKPIVHIATDEKFIDSAHSIYETAFPSQNIFLILVNGDQEELHHLSENSSYELIVTDKNCDKEIEKKIRDARIVVFHEMNFKQADIALSLKHEKISLVWSVFGYEIYDNPYLFGKELYGEKTYASFIKSISRKVKNKFRSFYYQFLKGKKDPYKKKIQAFEEMDWIAMLYHEEIELYKRRINFKTPAKQLKFTYYPLDVVVNKHASISGDNILVGNSATYTNNHLEIFDILGKMNIGDRNIICPLSYGNKDYGAKINKKGSEIFGSKFEGLTEFLPLEEYQNILQQCGIVIMNHYRQQAVGNVLNTMYLGAKVFLSNKNTLYHYLNRIGCHIYCIEEDLIPNNENVLKLLTTKQREQNRKILKRELSLERICSELQQKIGPLLQ